MLKTNSRIVRERIRIYILGNCEDIKESMEIPSNKIDDILKYVWSVFMENDGRFLRRGESFQDVFQTLRVGCHSTYLTITTM